MVEHSEFIVFGLLVSVAGLVLLPYPIFLVLGGLVLLRPEHPPARA